MAATDAQVWATLLEEDQAYLGSPRAMYRILDGEKEVRERRNQLRRPQYTKPELVATAPNQVWTWDLTKIRSPEKWTYYQLYVVLDLYSRMVVAWMLAHRESGDLAKDLFSHAYEQQGIASGQLTVHNDRGSAPTAKTLYQFHADLGVDTSVSRPYVSSDNSYSEAHFKTFKYSPGYPDRFASFGEPDSPQRGRTGAQRAQEVAPAGGRLAPDRRTDGPPSSRRRLAQLHRDPLLQTETPDNGSG